MGRLIYNAICSIDGYTEDSTGSFAWAEPDAEVHNFVNDLERDIRIYLYGRRIYETMAVWETDPTLVQGSSVAADYARIWQAATKIVFSTTLQEPYTRNTRIRSVFDPTEIAQLKHDSDSDLSIGGPTIAAAAIRAGLVDEYQYLLVPEIVGSGKPVIPADARISLELLEQRRFDSGTVFLRYRPKGSAASVSGG